MTRPSNTPPTPQSQTDWQEQTISLTRDMQHETIQMTLPVLGISSLLVLMTVVWAKNPLWPIAIAAALLALILVVWWVLLRSFLWASILLTAGTWLAIPAIVGYSQQETLIFLWILPVGLTALLLGFKPGALLTLISMAGMWIPLPGLAILSPLTIVVTGLGMVSVLVLIWLTLRPLLTAIQWSWASFKNSQGALDEARQYQLQLQQTLQEQTLLTSQLKRLNQMTHSLRLTAEEERRAKQEFVANVSHELRTPLNMIIGFSGTILSAPQTYGERVPPKLLADLQVIQRNSQHLSSLIDDVLDLSQIDADRMTLSKEYVVFEEIIGATTTAVKPLFQSKNLTLETQIAPDLPPIWCDPTRISEVLLNLLSNAGRFTEQGGVMVRTSLDEQNLIVSVQDTGLGISEQNRQKLFEPFQQVDGSIRRKYGGTGLGLSISKAFIELHDGEMWVASEVGQGTTFFFRLPVAPLEPIHSGPERWFSSYLSYDQVPHITQLENDRERLRLVVVENGDVMKKILGRHFGDAEIVGHDSISQAIDELHVSGAQALLVNSVDYIDQLNRLKNTDRLPYGIPAILCSLPGAEDAIHQLEIDNYLIKPISRETLLGAVEKLGITIQTILLVDDDPDTRQLFRRMLASAEKGYRVLRTENGLKALEILARETVDLILLDLTMPQMDGFSFLEERAKMDSIRDIPVITISARDPYGEPISSNALAITRGGGLSTREVTACVDALTQILSPIRPHGAARGERKVGEDTGLS